MRSFARENKIVLGGTKIRNKAEIVAVIAKSSARLYAESPGMYRRLTNKESIPQSDFVPWVFENWDTPGVQKLRERTRTALESIKTFRIQDPNDPTKEHPCILRGNNSPAHITIFTTSTWGLGKYPQQNQRVQFKFLAACLLVEGNLDEMRKTGSWGGNGEAFHQCHSKSNAMRQAIQELKLMSIRWTISVNINILPIIFTSNEPASYKSHTREHLIIDNGKDNRKKNNCVKRFLRGEISECQCDIPKEEKCL